MEWFCCGVGGRSSPYPKCCRPSVEKPVCSPGEPVQRKSGKEGNDETEIKNRSQNGKAASKGRIKLLKTWYSVEGKGGV